MDLDEKLPEGVESPVCNYLHAHEGLIRHIGEEMPREALLQRVSELFKVLGDGTRMRILYVLQQSEMCVCDLSQVLGMTISAVSHQLRILRQAHLVRYRREGKTVFYMLSDAHVHTLLSQGMAHVQEPDEE